MTAITKQKMGTHAGVSYSVQITKIDGLYYPRIVILTEPALIIDACIIFYITLSSFCKKNPFSVVENCAHGYIDAINESAGKERLKTGEIQKELGVNFLEEKLSQHRSILTKYKKLRSSLTPITEEFKEQVEQSAIHVKWLQSLIKNHYMSERYAGRTSTDY